MICISVVLCANLKRYAREKRKAESVKQPPTPHYAGQAANCQPPTINRQLPTANRQPPTANR